MKTAERPPAPKEVPAPREKGRARGRPAAEKPRRLADLRLAVRLIRNYSVGQRRIFVFASCLLVFEAGTAVFEAGPLAYLIEFLRGGARAEDGLTLPVVGSGLVVTIAAVTLGILLIAMVNSAADSATEILLARGGQTLGYQLRVALFGHLQRLSLSYHDRKRTGDVITRVTGDVKEVEEFVTDSLSDIAGSVLLLIGIIGFLLTRSWQVTALALAMIPLMAWVSNYFARRIKSAARRQRAREGDLASTTQEMLTSIRVVQTFGRGGDGEKRFARQSSQAMAAAYETARLEAWFSWIWNVLKAVAIGGVVWIGVWLIDRNALELGILVWLVILIEEMFKPTRKIIKEWSKIGKLYASVERIVDVLDREATVKDLPGARPAPRLRGEVRFLDVNFAYQLDPEDSDSVVVGEKRRQALKNVSFSASPGEVVALVGHSGAGKTSIAQLLPRLYDPQEGRVTLDGHDVRDFTLESLRSQISMVLQDTILFSGTVAENISYGRPDATRDEIVEAATEANAHEFIVEMPEGYDTELSERASNLSGGQRQRIAVARAIIRGTPLLLLDEPTTGMDAESTELVLRGLRRLMEGKTTLLISHDLNLIRSADRILVLKSGEIVQSGSHDELLEQGGLYAYLYSKQFSEGEVAPDRAALEPEPERALEPEPEPARAVEPEPAARAPEPELAPEPEPELAPEPEPEPARALEPEPAGAESVASEEDGEVPEDELDRLLSEVRSMAESLRAEARSAAPGQAAHTASRIEAAEGNGRGEGLDPLASPALRHLLPGLSLALDSSTMASSLRESLLGGVWGRFEVLECKPGKAAYLPGNWASVRYRLRLRERRTGDVHDVTVGGRVFRDAFTAAAFLAEHVAPLAEAAEGRAELAPFAKAAAFLELPPMVVYAWPIDADLPTLLEATDPAHMLEVFRSQPGLLEEGFQAEECRIEVAHYPRRDHCLLRYEIEGRAAGEPAQRVLYGKVAANRPARLDELVRALGATAEEASNGLRFRIPRPLAFSPELDLALVEGIPGEPVMGRLIKARASGAADAGDTVAGGNLEAALKACGRVAAVVHGSSIGVEVTRTFPDELAALGPALEIVRAGAPVLAQRLDAYAGELAKLARASEEMPLVTCHGDFNHGQVLFDGADVGLLDFDTVCSSEAALDLGRFCAYLRAACRRASPPGSSDSPTLDDLLCGLFLDAYDEAAPSADPGARRARVELFEALFLLRMVARRWSQLKARRTGIALDLLEERMEWLSAPRP